MAAWLQPISFCVPGESNSRLWKFRFKIGSSSNCFALNSIDDVGAVRLQLRSFARDFDGFRGSAHLKLAVYTRPASADTRMSLNSRSLEALSLDADGVHVRDQVRDVVVAALVAWWLRSTRSSSGW